MKTIEELENKIAYYNEAYRKGSPEISDSEYDKLVDELKTLDPNNDWFKSIEPAPVKNTRKRQLPIPMKSLNKVKSIKEISNWLTSLGVGKKMKIVCMPKFDGASMLVNENTGEAYTRGGSENEGQICAEHYLAISTHHKPSPHFPFTYGEVVFSTKNWNEKMKGVKNENGEEYKSPRNTAAALLNRDEVNPILSNVSFYRYGTDEKTILNYANFSSFLNDICSQYNQPKLYEVMPVEDITEEKMMKLYEIWRKEYYIDGIVLYINDILIWEQAGRHQTTGNPLYAVAYKHPDFTESFETTVKNVSWNISKSGAFKPVVNIEQVDTGDCTMENPTGYNAAWIKNNSIAKGAVILVTRSGGVIPKIIEVLTPGDEQNIQSMWKKLETCPHCGAATTWNESHVELCCSNPDCPGKRFAEIVFFFTILNVQYMGEETIQKMFNAGFDTLKKILDIKVWDLLKIEGFGESIANVILQNNKVIKRGVALPTLMQASNCFPGIGEIKAKKIIDGLSANDKEDFLQLKYFPTVSEKSSITEKSFINGLRDFYKFIEETQIPIVMYENMEMVSDKLSGKIYCISGFRDKELEKKIEENGGKVSSSVSKKTSAVIVADINTTSGKASKAIELNIPIIQVEEFMSYLQKL